jgi:hypothetical protein
VSIGSRPGDLLRSKQPRQPARETESSDGRQRRRRRLRPSVTRLRVPRALVALSLRTSQHAVVVGGVAALLAAGLVIVQLVATSSSLPYRITSSYFMPGLRNAIVDRPVDAILFGDGHAFAALASDPTMKRRDLFEGGASEGAYRAQRIALPLAAFAVTGGNRSTVPYALGAWNIISAGFLAAAVAVMARQAGRSVWWGVVIVGLPGTWGSLSWFGCELPAAALTAWTYLALRSPRHRAPMVAAVLAAGAMLTRETAALALVAMVFDQYIRRRLASLIALGSSCVVAASWQVVLRVRFGEWGFLGSPDATLSVPFEGVVAAIRGGYANANWWVMFALTALVTVGALAAARLTTMPWRSWPVVTLSLHLFLAVVQGESVWKQWYYFTRPTLTATTAVVVIALHATSRRRPCSSSSEHSFSDSTSVARVRSWLVRTRSSFAERANTT